MQPKQKKILKIFGISVLVIGITAGTIIIYRRFRKKKNAGEVEALMDLALKEGKLNEKQVDHIRFIFDIQNYSLPTEYQKAWDNNYQLMLRAKKELGANDFTAYGNTLNTIRGRLPASVKADFDVAFQLVKDMITRFASLKEDSSTLMAKIASTIKPATNIYDSAWYLKYNPIFGAGILYGLLWDSSGAQDAITNVAAIKSNPEYIIIQELYVSNKYTKNQLKLFDKIWEIFSGSPFFNTDVKNVKF